MFAFLSSTESFYSKSYIVVKFLTLSSLTFFCYTGNPKIYFFVQLKSWVSSLKLPRGLLHGMDVDGVPIDTSSFGPAFIKYNTGGAVTFSEIRRMGLGFDAIWKPGDAVLEGYDGDFRGVYINVELRDGEFRQYGVLPLNLFDL